MIWVIEYNDGTSITENQINFQDAKKNNVKYLYFLDQKYNKVYGFNADKMHFFIDNHVFDFKINGSYMKLIQYKNAFYQH